MQVVFKLKFEPYYSPAWTKKEAEWHAVMGLFLPAMPAMQADEKEHPKPEGWWDAWDLCQQFLNRTCDEAHGRMPYKPEAKQTARPTFSWAVGLTERYEAIDYNEYRKLHSTNRADLAGGLSGVPRLREDRKRSDSQIRSGRDEQLDRSWLDRMEDRLAQVYVQARNWLRYLVRLFMLDNAR